MLERVEDYSLFETREIFIEEFRSNGLAIPNVKKSIKELIKDGILSRQKFKAGKGGWTIYQLNSEFVFELFASEPKHKARWKKKLKQAGFKF